MNGGAPACKPFDCVSRSRDTREYNLVNIMQNGDSIVLEEEIDPNYNPTEDEVRVQTIALPT